MGKFESAKTNINGFEQFDCKKRPPFILSIRFLLAILMFFGIALQYAHKSDISVAIVCMVNHTALAKNNNESKLTEIPITKLQNGVPCLLSNASKHSDPDGQFVWSKSTQEFILSSYFYGYILSQLLGGWLSFKFGSKIVFLVSMLLGSIGTLLSPVSADAHYAVLIFCRFLTGLAQGVMWPTMLGMWSAWAPNPEKSILIGIGNSGAQIGTIVGFSLGGYLCTHGFGGGWPSIFYYLGIAGIIWCILWFMFTADSPSTHRFIKDNEKEYIIHHSYSVEESERIKNRKTPWKAIMTTRACIILFMGHFASSWGLTLFLTNAPTYMKEVLKFDIKSNGLLLSLPYLLTLIIILLSGYISDKLIKTYGIRQCYVRKLFNALGFLVPASMMIGLAYTGCDKPYLAVVFLTIGLGFSGCCNGGGFLISFNEVAGSYAGIVFGISNTFSSLTGIFVPYFVAAVTENQTQAEWKIVFFVTSLVYFIGALSNVTLGSSIRAEWAIDKKTPNP